MITGKIMPKFDLGQTVYYIWRSRTKEVNVCNICHGDGKIEVEGGVFSCPKCYGDGFLITWLNEKWNIRGGGKIGKIEAIWYLPEYSYESEVRYMLDVTGIGSGTLHSEDRLFATYEDAQRECEKRNLEEENNE